MRSHLTTLLAAAFLLAGTSGAIALVGGGHFIGLEAAGSASCEQYRPGNGFGDTNHCHTGPPGQTGEKPSTPGQENPSKGKPPASQFNPAKATASVSKRGAARVHCPFKCRITLRARHGHHKVHTTVTLHKNGTVTVRLTKKALKELGRGKALLVLEVNGKVISKKTLRFA
jgi:hypothetical protein